MRLRTSGRPGGSSPPSRGGPSGPATSKTWPSRRSGPRSSTMVPTAREKGTIKTSSRANVITATASPRLPQSRACTPSMSGQVATTIMTAHNKEGRKGLKIQKLPTMRIPINSTASVVRVRSRVGGEFASDNFPFLSSILRLRGKVLKDNFFP